MQKSVKIVDNFVSTVLAQYPWILERDCDLVCFRFKNLDDKVLAFLAGAIKRYIIWAQCVKNKKLNHFLVLLD